VTLAELDRFLAGEIPLDEFEGWIYSTPALEQTLAPGEYLALIELDYRSPHALHEAIKIVGAAYEAHRPGLLARDRAERVARGMLAGEINIAAGTRALARLYHEDNEWIPIAFVGIASELDDAPRPRTYAQWDPRALAERLRAHRDLEQYYRAPALVAARRLVELLHGIGAQGA
jgi:hypothetical protein